MVSAISTVFYGIKSYDINLSGCIVTRFCLEAQVAPVIAAPLAGVAVFAWVLF